MPRDSIARICLRVLAQSSRSRLLAFIVDAHFLSIASELQNVYKIKAPILLRKCILQSDQGCLYTYLNTQ